MAVYDESIIPKGILAALKDVEDQINKVDELTDDESQAIGDALDALLQDLPYWQG